MSQKYLIFIVLIGCAMLSSEMFENTGPDDAEKGIIDLENLFNYENQYIPEKAIFNHNITNPITDEGATLGRVLFYDKQLSLNRTVACASCHQQANAFGDSSLVSTGFDGGLTERHAMRLVNIGFSFDHFRFWDERASTLEGTVTQPFQNEIEMGFSGKDGNPGFDALIERMEALDYYKPLFIKAFGDEQISEQRMQVALAQFIRSIISFDSRFDEGYESVISEVEPFPNFTEIENEGKRLFFASSLLRDRLPERSGAFCGVCHKVPSFAILHFSQNNGVIGVAGNPDRIDVQVTRSPSIRDLVKPDGTSNGPFMHDGSLSTLEDVINHYDSIPFNPDNTNLSGLLFPDENGFVDLEMTPDKKEALVAFLKTLSGNDIYVNEKWSDPFNKFGQLEVRMAATECSPENSNVTATICDGEDFNGLTEPGLYIDTISGPNGCDTIQNLTLIVLEGTDPDCIKTSTAELDSKLKIHVFPNPFQDKLFFTNLEDGQYEMKIYNETGHLIAKNILQSKEESFNVEQNLGDGIYILHLKNIKSSVVQLMKVVKVSE